MVIGELAARTGVSPRSLRYYEQKGLIASERMENGYRDFAPAQVARVRAIQFYLSLGLSTDQIQGIFHCGGRQDEAAARATAIALYERQLDAICREIERLGDMRCRVERRLALLRSGDPFPPGID